MIHFIMIYVTNRLQYCLPIGLVRLLIVLFRDLIAMLRCLNSMVLFTITFSTWFSRFWILASIFCKRTAVAFFISRTSPVNKKCASQGYPQLLCQHPARVWSTFSAGGKLFFTGRQNYLNWTSYRKIFPLVGQTKKAKSSLQFSRCPALNGTPPQL